MRLYKDIDLTACRWQALFRGWVPPLPRCTQFAYILHVLRGPCYAFLPAWIFFVYVYVFTRRRNRDSMSRRRLAVPEQHRIKELQNRRPGGNGDPNGPPSSFSFLHFVHEKSLIETLSNSKQIEILIGRDSPWRFGLLRFVRFNAERKKEKSWDRSGKFGKLE